MIGESRRSNIIRCDQHRSTGSGHMPLPSGGGHSGAYRPGATAGAGLPGAFSANHASVPGSPETSASFTAAAIGRNAARFQVAAQTKQNRVPAAGAGPENIGVAPTGGRLAGGRRGRP